MTLYGPTVIYLEETRTVVADSEKSSKPRRGWLYMIVGGVVALVAVAVLVTYALVAPSSTDTVPSVSFDEPTSTTVPETGIRISGQSAGLPAGTTLWIVTKALSSTSTYQPHNEPCSLEARSGDWQCPPTFIGGPGDSGKHFQILLLDASPSAVDAFRNYDRTKPPNSYPGLRQLPEGATILRQLEVIRE
jgi:hypothetical protein